MSKRKLLLADDSITIQKVVNLTFADEGIDVITVGDGDSAMQKISEMSPDVILADVHMPGLNGYQICEIVRDNPVTSHTPVVLLVGSFEPFDESEAARVGANAFLTKPFQSIRQLVSQVNDLMESSSSAVASRSNEHSFDPPVDAPVVATEAAETNDIEDLYQQSFSGSGVDDRESASTPFVDAGMDDEMIDTSFTGESEEEQPVDSNIDNDYSPKSHEGDYTPGDFETVEFETDPSAGSFEEPVEESRTDSFDEAPAEPQRYVDQFAETEQIPAETAQQYRDDFDMDDIDLLDLPPDESSKTVEFTTPQSLNAGAGTQQIVSLSPELIETIVQKVVERLSEKH